MISCSKEESIKNKNLKELKLHGHVKSVKQFSSYKDYSITYFDRNGYKIKELKYENNEFKDSVIYTYNSKYKLIKEVLYHKGKPLLVYKYLYNQLDELIRSNCLEFGETLVDYNLYEYDSNSNLIKLMMYDSNLDWIEEGEIGLAEIIEYKYDKNNNKTFEKILAQDGKTSLMEFNYIYDNLNNLVSSEKFNKKNKDRGGCKYFYDVNNILIKQKCFKNENNDISYSYEFDSKRNWILKLIKENGSESILSKREIKYY